MSGGSLAGHRTGVEPDLCEELHCIAADTCSLRGLPRTLWLSAQSISSEVTGCLRSGRTMLSCCAPDPAQGERCRAGAGGASTVREHIRGSETPEWIPASALPIELHRMLSHPVTGIEPATSPLPVEVTDLPTQRTARF